MKVQNIKRASAEAQFKRRNSSGYIDILSRVAKPAEAFIDALARKAEREGVKSDEQATDDSGNRDIIAEYRDYRILRAITDNLSCITYPDSDNR